MARLRLADVPNAPQGVADPVMAQVPQFGFDGQTAARMLTQDTIRPGSFDGPAQGLQSIGQGLMNTSAGLDRLTSVLPDLAPAKKQDTKTSPAMPKGPQPPAPDSHLAQLNHVAEKIQAAGSASLVSTTISGLWKDYEKSKDLPEQNRTDYLKRSIQNAQEAFAYANLPPALAATAHDALMKTAGDLGVHAKYDGLMQKMNQYGQYMKDDMEGAISAGDYPRAGQLIDHMVSSGYQSEKQGAEMRQRLEDVQAHNDFVQALNGDPFKTLDAINETVRKDPSPRNYQWRAAAQQAAAQARTSQYAGLMQDLADGNVRDFADLETRYPQVDRTDHAALDRAIKQDVPSDPGAAADTLFALYDHASQPDSDPHSAQWNRTLFDVGTRLTGAPQKQALDLVQQIQSGKGVDPRVLTAVGSLSSARKSGLLADRSLDPEQGRAQAGTTALALLHKVLSYAKNNSDANEDKMNAYANSIIAPHAANAAAHLVAQPPGFITGPNFLLGTKR